MSTSRKLTTWQDVDCLNMHTARINWTSCLMLFTSTPHPSTIYIMLKGASCKQLYIHSHSPTLCIHQTETRNFISSLLPPTCNTKRHPKLAHFILYLLSLVLLHLLPAYYYYYFFVDNMSRWKRRWVPAEMNISGGNQTLSWQLVTCQHILRIHMSSS